LDSRRKSGGCGADKPPQSFGEPVAPYARQHIQLLVGNVVANDFIRLRGPNWQAASFSWLLRGDLPLSTRLARRSMDCRLCRLLLSRHATNTERFGNGRHSSAVPTWPLV